MQKCKSKFIRFISCLTLITAMIFASSVPSLAAGREDWGADYGPWEKMRITNNNTTLPKTIKKANTLYIDMFVQACKQGYCSCSDREPASYSSVKVHVILRNVDTKEVVGEDWVPETSAFSRTIKTTRPLRYNERIELFTDVCSAGSAPGPYRKAHIEYRYRFK